MTPYISILPLHTHFSLSTMPPKHSTSSKLNPFAPEYTPFSHAPPPPTSHFAPFPREVFTYIPPINQRPFSTHRPNRPPPPPAQPQAERYGASRRRGGGDSERAGGLCIGRSPNWKFQNRINNEREDAIEASRKEKPFPRSGNRHRVRPLKRDGVETTVMIKNIPYDCPRKELINLLDEFCCLENEKAKNEGSSKGEAEESAYDFVYLPFDFRSKRSRGFAFVNFTNGRAVRRFFDSFHGTMWGFAHRNDWHKIIRIVSAEIQGKEALVRHFTGSIFECDTDDFLPACFTPARDGSGQPLKLTVVGKRRPPPLGQPARNTLN